VCVCVCVGRGGDNHAVFGYVVVQKIELSLRHYVSRGENG